MPEDQRRSIVIVIMVWLYVSSRDPLFAVLLGIVGLGFVLTGPSFPLDRKRNGAS